MQAGAWASALLQGSACEYAEVGFGELGCAGKSRGGREVGARGVRAARRARVRYVSKAAYHREHLRCIVMGLSRLEGIYRDVYTLYST